MKRIGLFFGSFNPVHLGHLAIADFFAENSELEEIWLVISPQSPFKEKEFLMKNEHRLAMVKMAIEGKPKLKVCAEEFNLPSPNYTIDSLLHLKKKYREYQYSLILGQDNIAHFDQWKSYQQILEQFEIFVYPRSQSDTIPAALSNHPKIIYFRASLMEVSATAIRNAIKNKKSLTNLIPPRIQDYIRKFNPY